MGMSQKRFKLFKDDLLWLIVGGFCLVIFKFSVNIEIFQFQWYSYLLKIMEIGIPIIFLILLVILVLRTKFEKLYRINLKRIIFLIFCFKLIVIVTGVIIVLMNSYSIIK